MDLWGRGYTSTPLVPHDARLFSHQILYAAASSQLPWTVDGFSIIAFSLGGGIAMDFVASHPHLIKAIALLAPAGNLRSLPASYVTLARAAWDESTSEERIREHVAECLGVASLAPDPSPDGLAEMSVTDWQFHAHTGNVASFASTVQHGPIQNQRHVWRQACEILKDPLKQREKPIVICGSSDTIVLAADVRQEFLDLVGSGGFTFAVVDGDHNFVKPQGVKIVDIISRDWNLKKES